MNEISWFPVADDSQLDDYATEVWSKCQERDGFVPNVFKAYSWRGDRFAAWLAYFKSVTRASPTLGKLEREMIAVAVSMENGCFYCLAAHGYEVRKLLGDPAQGEAVTLDWRRATIGDRERAMLEYAVKVATQPRTCSREDIAALQAHGFSDEDVWDIAEVASLYSATNRMAMAAGFVPNTDYHGMSR